MVKKILEKAGFIESKTYKQTKFIKSPDETYCVYHLDTDTLGSDNTRYAFDVHCEIEMYCKDKPDEASAKRLISSLDEHYEELTDGYEIDGWMWIENIQKYQNIFRFDYIQKI